MRGERFPEQPELHSSEAYLAVLGISDRADETIIGDDGSVKTLGTFFEEYDPHDVHGAHGMFRDYTALPEGHPDRQQLYDTLMFAIDHFTGRSK